MSDNGAIVWAATYESFGSATITTATITNNLRFPGQYFDSESGLHYNWHRFYDPENGRYISADPIGLTGGINLYGYAHKNTVNWADPDGLRCITIGYEKRSWKVVSTGDPVWKHVSTVFSDGWAHGTSFWKIIVDPKNGTAN
ncbi:MAG: RHS repeat-associated core domain-containing protein [Desulfofustis sp. PB-SRB1]|jgi:RHS repeat-associated protein|nr:RHS repeat-associated core domain-containing protein [Desulfofustis sp. PB-SRB1]MBM1002738.1 RHS repeat-associated core domain-containing protein [Desulfofustis sp. PB-SRB1]